MKVEIVVLGQILNETITFPAGRVVGPILGGTLCYCAVAAARLGARVGIVGKIGRDTPLDLLEPIFQSGVDTEGLITEAVGYKDLLEYHPDGHKSLQFISKPSPLCLEDVPQSYRKARVIYCGSAMGEPSLEVVHGLCRSGTVVAADLGGYGGAHEDLPHRKGGYDDSLRELLPCLHIAKASREDCMTLFSNSGLPPAEHARLLTEWGAKVGIVTMGQEGAVIALGQEVFTIPAFTSKAIDTTGAGDVFSAGFLVHYQQHGDAMEAGIFASAAAALVCEKTGGVVLERMPSLADVTAKISLESVAFRGGGKP